MSIDLTIRQLLACLNVSVFDPVMEPALEHAVAERKDKRIFCGFLLYGGILTAAFLLFWALRPYAVYAGGALFCVCGLILKNAVRSSVRIFAKTYFLSSLLLLGERLFLFSPSAAVAVVSFFFVRSIFSESDSRFRTLIAVALFVCVCAAFENERAFCAGVFSVAGTAGLLFPAKRVYAKEAGTVFVLLPLLLLLSENLTISPEMPFRNVVFFATAFTADFILLACCLKRDLETVEWIRFISGLLILSLCGFFVSAGMQGCAVLFLTAFFTDFPELGMASALLFGAFFLVLLLSLPVSLFSAGIAALCVASVFEYIYFRLRG